MVERNQMPAEKKARKRRILVVEPDQGFCPELCDFLDHQRFEVEQAGSGDESIQKLAAFQPDIVLLSRELPMNDGNIGPDGLRVLKTMKQDRKFSRIPVILTSSESSEKDFERYRKLKFAAEDFIQKPFEDTEIIRRIENLVGFDLSDNLDQIRDRINEAKDDPIESLFNADPEEMGIASSSTRQEVSRLLEQVGQELDRHDNDLAEPRPADDEIEARPDSPEGEEVPSDEDILRLRQEFQTLNRQLEAAQKQLVTERKRSREIKKEWKQKLLQIEARLKESEAREARMRKEFETMQARFADLELEHTMELERGQKEKRHQESELEELRVRLEAATKYPVPKLADDLYKVVKALQTIIVRLEDDQEDLNFDEDRSQTGRKRSKT